jgi:hypothetical protein
MLCGMDCQGCIQQSCTKPGCPHSIVRRSASVGWKALYFFAFCYGTVAVPKGAADDAWLALYVMRIWIGMLYRVPA